MAVAVVTSADMLLHDPGPDHPEQPARLKAILDALEEAPFSARLLRVAAAPAERASLVAVHEPGYVDALERLCRAGGGTLDLGDTRANHHSDRAARLAAGAAVAAVDRVAAGEAGAAFAAVRPPGHHALADRAMGFCLFNNVAVAARHAQRAHALERVAVLDWDVHHGNGTQEIFYDDPSVLYVSSHQHPFYPGTGAAEEVGAGKGRGATLNLPLAPGTGDEALVALYRERVVPAVDAFRPDLVLVSAGFDAHRDDPLADLELSEEGYRALTRIARELAARHAEGRLVSVLEGGYDLRALAASVVAHVAELGA